MSGYYKKPGILQKNSILKCENCGSTNGYVKKRNNEFVCRKCGHNTKLK